MKSKTWTRLSRLLVGTPLVAGLMIGLAAPLAAFGETESTNLADVSAWADPCCRITGIDARSGLVTARDTKTGASFQFRVAETRLLRSLRVGQTIYVDQAGRRAGFAANRLCCDILVTPPPPQTNPRTKDTGGGLTVQTSAAEPIDARLPAGARLVRPPEPAPLVPGSRTLRISGTLDGRPAQVAVTVTPAGDLVNAVATGPAAEESRSWSDFWRTLRKRINDCKEKYPDDEKKRANCIDDAIIETVKDWFTGDL